MARYLSLLEDAIARLPTSDVEARLSVYERAEAALEDHMRIIGIERDSSEGQRHRKNLADAIETIERRIQGERPAPDLVAAKKATDQLSALAEQLAKQLSDDSESRAVSEPLNEQVAAAAPLAKPVTAVKATIDAAVKFAKSRKIAIPTAAEPAEQGEMAAGPDSKPEEKPADRANTAARAQEDEPGKGAKQTAGQAGDTGPGQTGGAPDTSGAAGKKTVRRAGAGRKAGGNGAGGAPAGAKPKASRAGGAGAKQGGKGPAAAGAKQGGKGPAAAGAKQGGKGPAAGGAKQGGKGPAAVGAKQGGNGSPEASGPVAEPGKGGQGAGAQAKPGAKADQPEKAKVPPPLETEDFDELFMSMEDEDEDEELPDPGAPLADDAGENDLDLLSDELQTGPTAEELEERRIRFKATLSLILMVVFLLLYWGGLLSVPMRWLVGLGAGDAYVSYSDPNGAGAAGNEVTGPNWWRPYLAPGDDGVLSVVAYETGTAIKKENLVRGHITWLELRTPQSSDGDNSEMSGLIFLPSIDLALAIAVDKVMYTSTVEAVVLVLEVRESAEPIFQFSFPMPLGIGDESDLRGDELVIRTGMDRVLFAFPAGDLGAKKNIADLSRAEALQFDFRFESGRKLSLIAPWPERMRKLFEGFSRAQ